MILASALGHELNLILGICGLIVLFGLLLKRFNQPYIIAYIITGVILGPSGFGMVSDVHVAELVGEFGLVILMFFIGMEISLRDFINKWRIALFGTGLQVVFSILIILLIGSIYGWEFKRVLLIGFIISLSSSAVVIKLVQDGGLSQSKIGQHVISILLTQDVLIVPMIVIMSFFGEGINIQQIGLQILGGVLTAGFLIFLLKKKTIHLPFDKYLRHDHELQVFASMIVCFGLAFITSSFELSAGLGAFVAGLFVHASPSTRWLHDSLHSFRVVLISVFFLSIGFLIDMDFLVRNWIIVSILVLAAYVSNHGINAFALKMLGNRWRESLFGGSLLAQVGEFSFVLASLGYHANIITNFSYQLTIIVISITIFISPFWVLFTKTALGINESALPQEYSGTNYEQEHGKEI